MRSIKTSPFLLFFSNESVENQPIVVIIGILNIPKDICNNTAVMFPTSPE